MKKSGLIFLIIIAVMASGKVKAKTKNFRPMKHLEWTRSANIYEVNIRQFTQKGDFKSFQKHLPRLKAMGVDILWLMPINPIGAKNRKGSLGSYYSVKDYLGINPEYGSMDDFKDLVNSIHKLHMYVIIDWVANHTSWDNRLITEHPDWFKHDKKGNIIPPVADWEDVAGLDYSNETLRKYMIDAMKFWVKEADIDGFRCDVAMMVPTDFWNSAREELDKVKPVFMLAEAEDPKLNEYAFDMTYAWDFHFILNRIAKGDTNALRLDKYYSKEIKNYAKDDYRMLFTSNHDENSWKGSEYSRMGKAAKTMAVLCYTFPGFPLIYSGQEAPINYKLKFFDKDSIKWNGYQLADFYRTLNKLKKDNPALRNGSDGGDFIKIKTNDDKSIYAFARKKGRNEIIAIFNLTKKARKLKIKDNPFTGKYNDVFSGKAVDLGKDVEMKLKKWEYLVLIRN